MASTAEREIQGDWSNLKGTAYHLIFAVWLILTRKARSIHFYAGNDLLSSPPQYVDGQTLPFSTLKSNVAQVDVWIQLKCTREPWTPSALLSENLISNFVINSFQTDIDDRPWKVWLVTEAEIRRKEVLEFLSNTAAKPDLNSKVESITARISKMPQFAQATSPSPSLIRDRVIDILRRLAETKVLMLDTLKAEVERELAHAALDRRGVNRVANDLIGAMIQDSISGPAGARPYDSKWVNDLAGFDLISENLFERDVVLACNSAAEAFAKDRLSPCFDEERFVERSGLANSLAKFINAKEPVFVLTGVSGRGKSWALANWAIRGLENRVRIMVSGGQMNRGYTFESLASDGMPSIINSRISPVQILQRMIVAAKESSKGTLILIIDNLCLDEFENSDREHLHHLILQVKLSGSKIVMSCEEQIWNLTQLWRNLPVGCLYSPVPPNLAPTNRSFSLSEFTTGELRGAISRWSASGQVPQKLKLTEILLRPEYLSLREPSVLFLYLNTYGMQAGSSDISPPHVDIDELLSSLISARLTEAQAQLGFDSNLMAEAFGQIIKRLWNSSTKSLPHGVAVKSLDEILPDEGTKALRALRRCGLLATESPVRVRDRNIESHLFATILEKELANDSFAILSLRVSEDSLVIEAMIRATPHLVARVEESLAVSDDWRGSVARGIAQRDPDLVTFSIAASLGCPKGNAFVDHDGCRALGFLAARNTELFDRVESMFRDVDQRDAFRGAVALSYAIDFVPQQVCRAVAGRWKEELTREGKYGGQKLAERLRDVLIPLESVKDESTAKAVSVLMNELLRNLESYTGSEFQRLQETIDTIRGRLIAFNFPEKLTELGEETRSEDVTIRYRAAKALWSFSHVRPEDAIDLLCEALSEETHPQTVARHLVTAVGLLESDHTRVLKLFRARSNIIWADPASAGAGVSLLGFSAHLEPDEVIDLLPSRFPKFDSKMRAWLSDVLAFAWWRLAAFRPEAITVLESLSVVDPEVDLEELQVFAERGAAIARLGILVRSEGMDRLAWVAFMGDDSESVPYYHTQTEKCFRRHAITITDTKALNELKNHLLALVRHAGDFLSKNLYHPFSNPSFFASRHSLDELVEIARVSADPVEIIRELPRDWEAIYASTQLLEAGVRSPQIVEFARAACSEHNNGGSVQAISQRDLCLAQLALVDGHPTQIVERAPLLDLFLGISAGYAVRLATLVDDSPSKMWEILDEVIQDSKSIVSLFQWKTYAKSWRTILVSEVFRRSFDQSEIDVREATRLVDQVIQVIQSLPLSSCSHECIVTWAAIGSWLEGKPLSLVLPSDPDSPLHQNHRLVAELFAVAQDHTRNETTFGWLDDFLWQEKCWFQTDSHRIKDGQLSIGQGDEIYLICMLPALRLALIAVGNQFGRPDPAGRFMTERYRAVNVGAHAMRRTTTGASQESLTAVVRTLLQDREHSVRDERVAAAAGHLLLLLSRLEESALYLQIALRSPLIDDARRMGCCYNLACVYARLGRDVECRELLERILLVAPGYRDQMKSDPDLESVRRATWFTNLVYANEKT